VARLERRTPLPELRVAASEKQAPAAD
jgi:hypothetical protein